MNYLIDTNIISEVRKGQKGDANFVAWWDSVDDADIYLSVLVLGEIRKGVERARPNDPVQANALEKWLTTVTRSYADRILPVDHTVADEWGRMSAKRPGLHRGRAACRNGEGAPDDTRHTQCRRHRRP